MGEYSLFTGCLIPFRLPHLERAARLALNALGIAVRDLEDASCCGDPIVLRSINEDTWLAVAARNICLAEEKGLNLLVLCNGCYESLKTANIMLKENERLRSSVNEVLSGLGLEFNGKIEVLNFLEVLDRELGLNGVRRMVKYPLRGLHVAVHYGCHMLRPSEYLKFDDVYSPSVFDMYVEALGLKSVPYLNRMLCCGAGLSIVDREASLKLVKEKLSAVKAAGAEALVVLCPFCYQQYDLGQKSIKQPNGERFNIPVFYYPELLCLSLGYSPDELGLKYHSTKVAPVLEKLAP
ncbi:MAG: CoB--CoM heterodisulfide reductase subunit B [Thermoproteota archaeon]|nr:MAG: CoB--CoM heterodisulfide reductase subunit B [Candidatus Korarchaeota archaeon]RLG56263.1 MAG: CoB--CoM heterodisulfide reductase subunit B [Candidatus Korarchaeota archaeon]